MSQYVFKRTGYKRQKYTSHACLECHRRKVKCSGGEACSSCRARGLDCRYEENNQRGRKPLKQKDARSSQSTTPPGSKNVTTEDTEGLSLKEQIVQLQQKVEAIYQPQQPPWNGSPEERWPSPSFLTPGDHHVNMDSVHPAPQNAGFTPRSHTNGEFLGAAPFDIRRRRSALFQTTDTFVPGTRNNEILSDSSKIEALQRLHIKKGVSSAFFVQPIENDSEFAVQLPKPSVLWCRVNDFFREFPCYFPFLKETKVRRHITLMLESVGFTKENLRVSIRAQDCKIMAILLNIIAYGEAVMGAPPKEGFNYFDSFDSLPGSESYCLGLDIMEHFARLHDQDIDTVTYHALSASFFFAIENLRMALSSATTSFHIARSIKLNDESGWPQDLDNEIVCRQSLWWTLYFLDKRISQKIGITYSVRENECRVREFLDDATMDPQGHHHMLQTMITFSHLWAKIWDGFFAPTSQTPNRGEELEVLDTRILVASRRLPSSLRWNTDELGTYALEENERQIRRRLLVYLRFCFLRLSIRHDKLESAKLERQRRVSCIQICKQMIDAIQAYINMFGNTKPSGYMLTSTLVESIYWVESERQEANPVAGDTVLINLTLRAGNALHDLAIDIGAAARAYESLNKILPSRFEALIGSSVPRLPPQTLEELFCAQGSMQNDEIVPVDPLGSIRPIDLDGIGSFNVNSEGAEKCIFSDREILEESTGESGPGFDWTSSLDILSSAGYSGISF